eukprot:1160813-Pelagomonas_calceolata.AAC.20
MSPWSCARKGTEKKVVCESKGSRECFGEVENRVHHKEQAVVPGERSRIVHAWEQDREQVEQRPLPQLILPRHPPLP